ncbi:substrate-binding domain-containing protein [Streptomyces sp. NE06-03E]|uniref:caspase family protein n=1 Tax=unclassified Streptomyces TaxID=2593676 RepID=UPI0029A9D436|nr:substrate-binding domain-containing protein [Streptomyces sp. NE06-03E]MDX3058666.1 substrate-binding domain-containing protein [Streptomyces sp. NE06-03E]
MPPYDARGEENGRKRHRAVLIGVEHYTGTRNDLPAVATNLRLMREALTAERTGVLGPDDLVVIPADGDLAGGGPPGGGSTGGHTTGGSIDGSDMDSSGTAGGDTSGGTQGADMGSGPKGGTPKGPAPAPAVDPLRVRAALAAARRDVTGLLVVYFAGHGIVRPDGSDLNLMFTDSRVTRDRHHPFVDTLSWRDDVMPELRNSRADWVVVILDCCFAGNALRAFSPAAGQNFALLTAAEPGVEIPPGDPRTGTEFTAALHRLLTTGEEEPVTFTRTVAGIRRAMAPLKAVDGHPWIPDELRHGDDVVLAHPVDAEPPPPPSPTLEEGAPSAVTTRWPRSSAQALPRRLLAALAHRLTRTTAVALAGVVALAAAGAWYLLGAPSGGDCASPLELRVLTDPDLKSTVQKAADAYPKRDGDGCRTVGVNVYDAKATDAVTALRSSSLWQEPPATCPASGDCPRPQRDVGAQPDIWIPAAGSAWQRATAGGAGGGNASSVTGSGKPGADAGRSVVDLDRLGSVAYTPMVLGVPDTMALAQSLQTDDPLGTIVTALEAGQPVEILRPDPEDTEGALLATDALYASSGSGRASTVEQGMAQALRPMPSTARELMCVLADGAHNDLEDRAAVLVPEQTLAQFNLSAGEPGRPGCASEALAHRVAHYPSDVPMLDLPFVRVTWAGADRDADARTAAVEDFYEWLATDPDAQKCFTDDGFRGVGEKGGPAAPADDSVLRSEDNTTAVREQIPVTGPDADASASLSDTLSRYRGALGPGRVLYLLDNSTSMADKRVWDGTGGAKELVARSMTSLGAGDSYGVRMAAVAEGRPATDLVPFGPNTRAGAQKAVARAGTAAFDARIAAGLDAALGTLRGEATGAEQPRLLVLVTDGEDFEAVAEKEQKRLVAEAGKTPLVRIVTVSLQDGACTPGRFGERLADASGGRCLDPADDIAAELAAEVARTGTGDAE